MSRSPQVQDCDFVHESNASSTSTMASSSPSPQQQFCLRWNNHQSALVSVFDHLLQSEAFVDVTLAVEGLLLRAHKLVLSACSPYFQAMFASHPAKHPIIILKDVRYNDLRALLDFMYKGEVAVDQDRLPAFLRLAESLKIRGLAEFCEESLSQATSQPPIFDSLLDSQKRSHPSGPPSLSHQQSQQQSLNAVPAPLTAVELLPVSNQRPPIDFSVPAMASMFGSPIPLASVRSSSSMSSSTKRPSSPQTYAHHRRKRGRPPRQSYSESAGILNNVVGLKSNASKDARSSSPEVMEMNVDLLSMGVSNNGPNTALNPHAPINSNAHDSSCTAQDDHIKGASSRNSSPVNNTSIAKHESSPLLEPDTRPDGLEPQAGPSQESEFDSSRRGGKSGKGNRRARGRPRGYGRNANSLDRSLLSADSLDDLAGPSQREGSSTPDRTLLGGSNNSNSNNTEQLQEMSIRGLNLFRYASVSEEGMYRCIPCEKEHVTRTFKNKYSFQRHAYLYHEGNQRKVFPCLVCGREFSRPDKLKHHLKTVHDYAVPREYSNAYYSLP